MIPSKGSPMVITQLERGQAGRHGRLSRDVMPSRPHSLGGDAVNKHLYLGPALFYDNRGVLKEVDGHDDIPLWAKE